MNGVLLVDKPVGVTSHDVVAKVRRLLGTRSVGHAGTLDPLASGLLVLLVGEATKVSDYLLNGDKGYEVKVKLGVRTDSMDITGEILKEQTVDCTSEQIEQAAFDLQGDLELEVPVHSAVKVDGQRLYKMAHKGERPVKVPARVMKFYDLMVKDASPTSAVIQLKCSKGSFVRSWANHLGETLGCGGTVETLRRTFSSPFEISQALTMDELEGRFQPKNLASLGSAWIPLKDSIPHFMRVDISGQDETMMRNGQISNRLQTQLLQFVRFGETMPPIRVISRDTNDLVSILLAEPGQFYRIKRVFARSGISDQS